MVFKIIGVALPLVLFIFLELVLRLFGYGSDYSVFKPYGDTGYMAFNQEAPKLFFSDPNLATRSNQELFKKEKDPDTYRIFVMGESTTIGYPYFHNGSFHRWLRYRLMNTYPDKKFEIINISLTAVNSYTIREFSDAVAAQHPDAVLIYLGHNEYYGALGVGSTQVIGSSPWMVNAIIQLKKLRSYQLLENGYKKIVAAFAPKENPGERATRMENMVSQKEIPLDSKEYQIGLEQFQANMSKVLQTFDQRHIPVLLANLVSNEKGIKPFISPTAKEINDPAFSQAYELGLKALAAQDSTMAMEQFQKANTIYGKHALCNYYLGQLTLAQQDTAQANIYFDKAKELDLLRFRAPEAINTEIGVLADTYPNTHLVDVAKLFHQKAPGHIIGNELLTDHVHPNLYGYALMSDAYFKELQKVAQWPNGRDYSFKKMLKTMPVTLFDSIWGVYGIDRLKVSWPYNEPEKDHRFVPKNAAEQLVLDMVKERYPWRKAHDRLFDLYLNSNERNKATKVAEALALEYGEDPVFYDKAGSMNLALDSLEKGLVYERAAYALDKTLPRAKRLAAIQLMVDRPKAALPYLEFVVAHEDKDKAYYQDLLNNSKKLTALDAQGNAEASGIDVLLQKAQLNAQMGNMKLARSYAQQVVQQDPKNEQALTILSSRR